MIKQGIFFLAHIKINSELVDNSCYYWPQFGISNQVHQGGLVYAINE